MTRKRPPVAVWSMRLDEISSRALQLATDAMREGRVQVARAALQVRRSAETRRNALRWPCGMRLEVQLRQAGLPTPHH